MERLTVRRKDLALGQRNAQALGHLGGSVEVGARQDHRELLSAPAGGGVDLAHRFPERRGEVAQDHVAGRMAVAVVHRLEVVHVGEDQRDRTAQALVRGRAR